MGAKLSSRLKVPKVPAVAGRMFSAHSSIWAAKSARCFASAGPLLLTGRREIASSLASFAADQALDPGQRYIDDGWTGKLDRADHHGGRHGRARWPRSDQRASTRDDAGGVVKGGKSYFSVGGRGGCAGGAAVSAAGRRAFEEGGE